MEGNPELLLLFPRLGLWCGEPEMRAAGSGEKAKMGDCVESVSVSVALIGVL